MSTLAKKCMIEELIEDKTELIIKIPDNSILYEERGDLYYQLEEYEKAIEDYNEAIKFGDKLDICKSSGEFYSATETYDDVDCGLEWGVKGETPYIKIGDVYCKLEEYEKAIGYYEEVTSLYDHLLDPETYMDEGEQYSFSHRDTFNIKDEYYEKKGYAHYKLGEYEEAIDDYTKAIELNVDKYRYYDKRGAANYRLEKYKEAANDYARAISILESIK